MKRNTWLGVGVLIVIAIVIIALLVQHNKATAPVTRNSDMNMNTNSNGTNSAGNNPTKTTADKVVIQNFAFSPASISVKVGTTVTWTNQDSTAHTVTADNTSGGFDSGTLDAGKSYSFTFAKAGTYTYHCNFHSSMHGTVIVTE